MKAYALKDKMGNYVKLGGKRIVFDTIDGLKKSYRRNFDMYKVVNGEWRRVTDTFPGDYEIVEFKP
jgi:hypothetical protein